MEIHIPKVFESKALKKRISNTCQIKGWVTVKHFDKEDVNFKEPVFVGQGDNAIQGELLDKIVDHIDGTNAGNSSYQLSTGTTWFTDSHGAFSQSASVAGPTDHDQHGKDGIILDANASVPYGGLLQAFFLGEEAKSQSVTNNVAQWVARSKWRGTNDDGGGNTGTITALKMGKFFVADDDDQASFPGFSDVHFSSYTVSSFTMQPEDQVEVTWNITVG